MKIMIIGMGQCGNRVADEFARLGVKARRERGAKIITDAIALDTDASAMGALQVIKSHQDRRIVVGEATTRSHGTGRLADLGKQIFEEDGYKIIDAIRKAKRFPETDAFLLITGVAGGTGSGGIPVLVNLLKDRFPDKPVYCVAILPFEHEEEIDPRNIVNTAVCLKSLHATADAIFLIDNQRYVAKGYSLAKNIAKTNKLIAEPFYSLLCAGEETNRKRIGVNVLDAGGIIQSLSGWTVLGYGKTDLPMITFPWEEVKNKGNQTMDIALSELSLSCDTKTATETLYLVSAPEEEMNLDLVKHLGERIRSLAPDATIRFGDYPFNKGFVDVTILFSGLKDIDKITDYYLRSVEIVTDHESKREESTIVTGMTEEAARDVRPIGT